MICTFLAIINILYEDFRLNIFYDDFKNRSKYNKHKTKTYFTLVGINMIILRNGDLENSD